MPHGRVWFAEEGDVASYSQPEDLAGVKGTQMRTSCVHEMYLFKLAFNLKAQIM